MDQSVQKRLLQWLLNGETGMSSKEIVRAYHDLPPRWHLYGARRDYPLDPADFRRCLLLLEAVPEIREQAFQRLAEEPAPSPWPALVARWDEIAAVFLEEWGPDRPKNGRAPLTYKLMREITCR